MFFQHHELTGDKRERETGSWVCPAGKLQLRQRSLSRITGTNQEVRVHFTGQQFSAKMAAGTYFLREKKAIHLNSWASFLKFMRFSAVARNKWGERSRPGHHVHSGELPAGGGACNTQQPPWLWREAYSGGSQVIALLSSTSSFNHQQKLVLDHCLSAWRLALQHRYLGVG